MNLFKKAKNFILNHAMTTVHAPKKKAAFRKHCGIRRKCLLPAISALSTTFSTISKRKMHLLRHKEIVVFKHYQILLSKMFVVW